MSFDPAELLRELTLADGERFFDDLPTVGLFDEPMMGEQGAAIFNRKGVYGCGLCQTAVPCEFVNPVK